MKTRTPSLQSGVSLIEILVIISVLAALVGIASIAPIGIRQGASEAKLRSDVATINSAVSSYIAFNGKLDGATNPEDVLSKLKTIGDEESSATTLGLRGQFLDQRTDVVLQSEEEAGKNSPRAYWDSTAQKFRIATSGPAGVKQFVINEEALPVAPTSETRAPMMKLAKVDTWIWDYEDKAAALPTGPSTIPVTPVDPDPTDPETSPPTATPPTPGTSPLEAPIFTVPSGEYPITDYNLSVGLTNPNPSGSSRIAYSIDYGNWIDYGGGSFTVAPGSVVRAQALPIDSTVWSSSGAAQEQYAALPLQLDPPVILPSAEVFNELTSPTILTTLENPNNPATSATYYRIGGGAWTLYTTPFPLLYSDFKNGVGIDARVVPTQEYFLTSPLANASIGTEEIPEELIISGVASGAFSNVTGQNNLITNLTNSLSGPFVEWGQGVIPFGGLPINPAQGTNGSWASSMTYGGKNFSNVKIGDRFKIGSISYFNGTIRGGTGATSVDLSIVIDIEGGETVSFDHTIDMINSPNVEGDEVASADSVKFVSLRSERPARIGDKNYRLFVEFGRTGANGFATIDEFFVFENETTTGTLFGRLEEVGGGR